MITPKPTTVFGLFNGHPERWCQGTSAKDFRGVPADYMTDFAASRCVDAAISYIYGHGDEYTNAVFALSSVIPGTYRHCISEWNDFTTFETMLAKVKEAGI